MIKRILPLVLILALGAIFALLLLNPKAPQPVTARPLPQLTFTARGRQTVTLPLDGKGIVVNLFASWCVPCAAEMPWLTKLAQTVPVYGIAYKDRLAALDGYLQRYGNPFASITLDDGRLATQLGITGVPESFLVDPAGRIVRHLEGAFDDAQLADWQREIASWKH